MAKKPEIRYINYYTSGSAAYQLAPKPEKKTSLPKPKVKRAKQIMIRLDPVALAGIVVAAAMVIMMAVGMIHLSWQQQQTKAMQNYVEQLKAENAQLKDTYAAGYDLDEVEKMALSWGMVPGDTISARPIQVVIPQVPEETSAWDEFVTFLTGLFA